MKDEPNVCNIRAPLMICGDIHGHFNDLLEIFKIGGNVPYTNYLFLGDYVNQGTHAVDCLTLLLLLKAIIYNI